MTELAHTGPSHLTCPACAPRVKAADHLAKARVRKVYGRVSQNARREHAWAKREASALYQEAYRDHLKAQGDL